jgi:hypothetical protein
VETNGLHTLNSRRVNWIGQVLSRNCIAKHVSDVKIEVNTSRMKRREKKRKHMLDDFKEKKVYWILKEEALDRTLWRTRFGMFYAPAARQTKERKLCFYSQ